MTRTACRGWVITGVAVVLVMGCVWVVALAYPGKETSRPREHDSPLLDNVSALRTGEKLLDAFELGDLSQHQLVEQLIAIGDSSLRLIKERVASIDSRVLALQKIQVGGANVAGRIFRLLTMKSELEDVREAVARRLRR